MKKIFVAATLAATLSGCAVGVYPGGPSIAGGIMTSTTQPAQSLTVATDATAKTSKSGSASTVAFLGLFAMGDSSVNAAMNNGGITKVHNVDHSVNSFLFGLYSQTTTTVHGE